MATVRADRGGRERGLIVVKIGSSLLESGRVKPVLAALVRSRRPVVVVPGGGALTECIRRMQSALGFSDAAAHRMALLAMHQTGMAMADLQPRLIPVETLSGMQRAIAAGRVPVWLPLRLSDRDHALPADNSITSDGLAARLGERLGAALLVLLKSRSAGRGASLARLVGDGVVDQAFATIVARSKLPCRILGPTEVATLAEIVGASAYPGPCAAACRGAAARVRRARRRGPRVVA